MPPETPVLTRELSFRIGLVSLMLLSGAFGFFEWMLAHGGGAACLLLDGESLFAQRFIVKMIGHQEICIATLMRRMRGGVAS